MKMIAGWIKPDSGTIEIGQTVKLGYFSQENEDMDTSLKVIDYIKNVAEYVKTKDGSISASQMLERFLFPPSVQYTVIEKLSGGERRRLYLLKILMSAPNVLILDEPITGLDPASTQDFYAVIRHLNRDEKVAVLMVSHDIGNIVTQANKILQLKQTVQFYGTVDEYKKSEFGREFLGGEN